jgi:hypothetical protein
VTAIRIIRGYKTVSYVLIGDRPGGIPPPFELQALALKEKYEGKQALLQGGPEETLQHVDLGEIENHTWRRWRARLEEENRVRPHRAVCAVLPNWEKWRNQKGAPLMFRMTQILTGHGVFGEFLLRIGKETTSICHHCQLGEDSALHTLMSCPAWEELRRVLRTEVGGDIGPEALRRAILEGRQGHSSVRTFCEQVMPAKERAERERVRTGDPARVDRTEGRARRGRSATPLVVADNRE